MPPVVEVPVVEVPVVRRTTVPAAGPKATRSSTPRAPKAPAKPVKAEPTVAVCPSCFMAIPATGVCDNCG